MANSDDEAVLNHSSDESVEEVPQIRVRRPRIFCDRVNFEVCDFKDRFRLTIEQVNNLIDSIGQFLQHDTNRNKALTPRQQVLIALRFLLMELLNV